MKDNEAGPLQVAVKAINTRVMRSPIEMASSLLEQKADPKFIGEMLDLQIKHERNEAMKAYHVAMAEFKKEPIKILKDKKVGYKDKQGNFVGYSHASLGNVTDTINSKLSKHGFSTSWKQSQADGSITVSCTVTHSMGHSESTSLTAPPDTSGKKNSIQAIGSTVSYLNRYTLLAITGQATYDQDDDGVYSGNPNTKQKSDKIVISKDELDDLKMKMQEKNVSEDTIIRTFNKKNLWSLTYGDYKTAINKLGISK